MSSKSFCILPWVHVCVRSNDKFKPCCRYDPGEITVTSDLDELLKNGLDTMNNDHLVKLRSTMLKGDWDNGCKKCLTQENGGITSMRQFMNERYKFVGEQLDSNFNNIYYLEMTIDNVCNLQCAMCSSEYSSKLQKRDKLFNDPVYKKLEPNYEKFDSVDLSKLFWIKILGGEPFVSPNFEKFLDYVIEKSNPENISIEIATNATVFPNETLLEKMNRFKKVYINVSLDSFDKSNDYQRFGSSYLTTFNNSNHYLKLFRSVHLAYHCTISILTANTFETMLYKIVDDIERRVSFDFVKWPDHLSVIHTPEEYALWLRESITHPYALKLVDSVLKDHKYNEEHWNKFLYRIKKNDEFFKIRLEDYNLSLANFLKDYK